MSMAGDEHLFIFDKDGTLVMGPAGRPPKTFVEQTWLPNVQEKCRSLVEGGHTLAVASNQGGVAFGYLTYEEAEAMVRATAFAIGAVFYEFCPYHPEGIIEQYAKDALCRKPSPGMLQSLQVRTGFPWDRIIFVGNGIEDWKASLFAGCKFVWATDFF
jgi:D-glycero-D-manno-heptose 1,7-bisphosphate phosphatase